MIRRIWHGRTPRSKAHACASLPGQRATPDYRSVPGNLGAAVLRPDYGDVTHFLTVTPWESRDRIHAFEGGDLLKAGSTRKIRTFSWSLNRWSGASEPWRDAPGMP